MRSASISRSGSRARAALAIAAACCGIAGVGALSAQGPTSAAIFRARTDLVVLQVAVTDGRHRHVPGLGADSFTVYEQGRQQPIVAFSTSAAPLDVLLLIDTSGSMAARLAAAQQAALDLVATLRDGDRAGVILFNTIVDVAQPLTENHDAVAAAIRGAAPAGSTALYEAIYLALRALSPPPADGSIRRRAVVVLSDGQDTSSHIPFEHTLDAAQTAEATIYTIMPAAAAYDTVVSGFRWRDASVRYDMRQLAEGSGGRAFTPGADADLAAVYAQIGSELREQYWIAYAAPAAGGGGFRRVSVRVTDPPGLVARTRTGYEADRNRISASRPLR